MEAGPAVRSIPACRAFQRVVDPAAPWTVRAVAGRIRRSLRAGGVVRAVKQQVRSDTAESSAPQIRATDADDVPIVVSLAEGTRVFTPNEIIGLQEDLEHHLAGNDPADRMLTLEHAGRIVGFAHYGPAEITEGTWYLYWIAVDRRSQGHGYGALLLGRVETEIQERSGRLALIETSMLPRYEPTRRFYDRYGYERECVIRDYYSVGDDKVIFSKRLAGRPD